VNNTILSTIAVLGLAAAAPVAQGQAYNPFQIGASGGIAFPTGDLGTGNNTGYTIVFAVGYKPQMMPISLRAEAAYNQFGFSNGVGSTDIIAFTGNVQYDLPLGMSFTPYAIGGVGVYRPTTPGFTSTSITTGENDFGWNIGGGIKIPLSTNFETFIEARYNRFNPSGGTASFIPVTVGIMF
jgi:opacity protein-like surface antigen